MSMTTVSQRSDRCGRPRLRAPPRTRRSGDWTGWTFVGPFMRGLRARAHRAGRLRHLPQLLPEQLIGGNAFVGFDNYIAGARETRSSGSRSAASRCSSWCRCRSCSCLALFAALAIDSARLHGRRVLPHRALPALRGARRRRRAHVGLHLRRPVRPRRRTSTTSSASHVLAAVRRSSWMLASIGNIVTWEFVGYNMLIFYAALRVDPRPSSTRRPRSTAPASSASIFAHQDPGAARRHRDRDDLLDHRQLPALQRAEHPASPSRPT